MANHCADAPDSPDGADGLGPVATALAHAGRRRVVTRLSGGPATSGELARLLGVAMPTLLRHLDVLRSAGLLDSSKSGRVVTHRLRPEPLEAYGDWLRARRAFWTERLDDLGTALDAAPTQEDPA